MEKRVRVKTLRLFLVFICTSILLFSSVNQLKKVDVIKGELRLHFSQAYDKEQVRKFALTNPYRLVFDFENTRLTYSDIARNLDKSIRIAQFKPNTVRIVIENERAYNCTAYQPFFSKTYYHIPLPKYSSKLPAIRYKKPKLKIEMKEAPVTKKNKKKVKKTSIASKASNVRKHELIVIDAGHGGHDSGASCGGKKEKHLALHIAKKVATSLKNKGYNVYLTRTTDRFLKLSQRTKIADKKNAAAFVSIHANSVPKRNRHKVQGIETYFLQNTRDARSQRIAARENALVLKGAGSKLSKNVIIDSVLSGPKIIESNKLAIDVQRRMVSNVRSKYKDVKDGGVRHAPFYVLVGASRPSILVEVGYLSHLKERKRLFTKSYQDLIIKGISEGIDNYLINRKKEIDF